MLKVNQLIAALFVTTSLSALASPVIQAPEDNCTRSLRTTALTIIKSNRYIKTFSTVDAQNPVFASKVQRGAYIVPACGGSVIITEVKRDKSGSCTFTPNNIQVDVGNIDITSLDPRTEDACKKRLGHN